MTILRLSFAGLKKKKSAAVTLLLLAFLSTLFLDMGISRNLEAKSAFSDSAQRLNSPDFICVTAGESYDTIYEDFLNNDTRVDYVEKEDVIYVKQTENSANSLQTGAVIFNKDTSRQIELFHLFSEDTAIPKEKAIYLPKTFEGDQASLGEEFVLTIKNIEYPFLIAGFFETSYMGTTGFGMTKYYLPEESFQRLYETVGAGKVLSAVLKENVNNIEISEELSEEFLEATDFHVKAGDLMSMVSVFSYAGLKDTTMSLFLIPISISMSIAFTICLITCIIVFIKVKESIEENMINFGNLMAMGYTSGQIICSQIAEYALIGLAGGVAGILGSYLFLPLMTNFEISITGLMIRASNPIGINVISAMTVLFLIIASAFIAGQRIKKIPPVEALRKGMQTHHFGRNFFPLQNGSTSLHYCLALKNMMGNFKQSITTILVIFLGVFSISITVVIYANFGYDRSAVVKMTGIEIADVQVKMMPHVEAEFLQKEIEAMEEVHKTNLSDSYMAKIGKTDVFFTVSEDFDETETLTITEGEFPKYDNEVVLTSKLLMELGKSIGDTVPIKTQGVTRDFVVVGESVGTNNGGRMGFLHLEGMQRMNPYYRISQIDVYLNGNAEQKAFIEKLDKKYLHPTANTKAQEKAGEQIQKLLEKHGINSMEYAVMQDGEILISGDSSLYQIKEISSLTDYLNGQLKSYTSMMSGLMIIILLVMLLIMGAIISLTIKSVIHKQKEEFGIFKAIGYTTKDIMRIIQLNVLVNAAAGALLGGLICRFTANPVLKPLFNSMGMSIGNFQVNSLWLIGIAICIVVYVWLLSMLKINQVRRITVYELLTE